MQITEMTEIKSVQLNLNPLHYYKCLDCLTPVSTDVKSTEDLYCDCGGESNFEYMGRVQGTNIVKPEEQCKCNSMCTHASGPTCDCICLGANHGHGRKAYITVNKITGKVERRIKCKETAAAHAEWYRNIKAKIKNNTIYGDFLNDYDNRKAGVQIDRTAWMVIWRTDSLKHEFVRAKTFKKREQVFEKIKLLTKKGA